jgi:poly(beta-D-mannuronate) lyase
VRKWTLASFSSSFIQISEDERLSSQHVRIVKAWLNLIAQNVRNEYSRQLENRTRQNNHMYWAAWATMITAVLVEDTDMFNWSVDKLKFAINQISDDGTLPLEMERMGKAFNYHVFAAGPLIMMAETAEKNGINIYEFRKGALKNLINRILTELETDQAYITQTLDRKQNIDGTLTPGQLAWMEPYYARFKEPRMEKWLEQFRPMIQRRLGGNLSQYFSE